MSLKNPNSQWHENPKWGSRELKENWANLFRSVMHIFTVTFIKICCIKLWCLVKYIFMAPFSKDSWINLWRIITAYLLRIEKLLEVGAGMIFHFFIGSLKRIWHIIRSKQGKIVTLYLAIGIVAGVALLLALIIIVSLNIKTILVMGIVLLLWHIIDTKKQINNLGDTIQEIEILIKARIENLANNIDDLELKIDELESTVSDI